MKTNALEILECGRQTVSKKTACAEFLYPFDLELFGVHLYLGVLCRSEKVTLKDLVLPARQLCDIVIQQTIKHQLLCGQPVRCSAGCMACCKYAITVSRAEALAISDMIVNLPRHARQTLLRNMTKAGRKILGVCRSTIGAQNPSAAGSSNPLAELSRWYAQLNLICPYIEDKLCRHYADRPLVCREFMVASPPARCVPHAEDRRVIVDLPIRMSEVLMDVSAKLTGTNPQAMFLPLVPAWDEGLSGLQDKYFDSRSVAEILIGTIHEHQKHKTTPATECCQSCMSG